VKVFAERLMSAEAEALCGADYGERSEEQINRRNGYRERTCDTRASTIELACRYQLGVAAANAMALDPEARFYRRDPELSLAELAGVPDALSPRPRPGGRRRTRSSGDLPADGAYDGGAG
jgi:Transposase, Mutator family